MTTEPELELELELGARCAPLSPSSRPSPRRRRMSADDDGQLMLVAGIVITIAFLMTALTLSEVSSLEREAAAQKPLPMADEWRFLHDRLSSNLKTAVANDMSATTFKTDVFPAIAATFRDVEAEKGYDAVFRLATTANGPHSESTLVQTAGHYDDYAIDGVHYTQVPDGTDDGVLWNPVCPTLPSSGCIVGVYVLVHLSDGASTMDEYVLISVDQT